MPPRRPVGGATEGPQRLRFNAAMPPRETVTVFFDYVCPYAWRGAELSARVAGPLGIRFEWHHFSLYQANHAAADGWQLWNDRLEPGDAGGSKGLLPFLASIAARRQDGGARHDDFRLALMRSRHRDHRPFVYETVMAAAEEAGLHLACFERDLADPEGRTRLAREHGRAVAMDVFGTPTFRLPTGDTAYVRLKHLPADTGDALALFRDVRSMLRAHPYLETLRRPRAARN